MYVYVGINNLELVSWLFLDVHYLESLARKCNIANGQDWFNICTSIIIIRILVLEKIEI